MIAVTNRTLCSRPTRICMPPCLLRCLPALEQAAASKRVTLDEFVTEIIERGLKPSDVQKAHWPRRARATKSAGAECCGLSPIPTSTFRR